jgi:hypothetical protein
MARSPARLRLDAWRIDLMATMNQQDDLPSDAIKKEHAHARVIDVEWGPLGIMI